MLHLAAKGGWSIAGLQPFPLERRDAVRISDSSLRTFRNHNRNRNRNRLRRLFDHEKLEVNRASLAILVWLEPVLEKLPKSLAVADQLIGPAPRSH